MERIIKANGANGLEHALFYYGLDLELYRPIKRSVYSTVHGRDSGDPIQLVKTMRGIIQSDDFFPSTGSFSGNYNSAFLYTNDDGVLVGDEIKILAEDDKRRHYKITEIETLGLTTEVFKKYKLSNTIA